MVPVAAGEDRYQRLNPASVRATLLRLQQRIRARIPERNLLNVASEVVSAIDRVQRESTERSCRRQVVTAVCGILVGVIAAAAVFAIVLSVRDALDDAAGRLAFEWLPVLESGINDIAFAGIATFFLLRIPSRLQRRTLLASLHRLRSLARVIDMRQLTKDPDDLLGRAPRTDGRYRSS